MWQFIVAAAMAVGGGLAAHMQQQKADKAGQEKEDYDKAIAKTNLWETRNAINALQSRGTQNILSQYGQSLSMSRQLMQDSESVVGTSNTMAAGSGAVIGEGSPHANEMSILRGAEQAIYENNKMGEMFAKQALSDQNLDLRNQRRQAKMLYMSALKEAQMERRQSRPDTMKTYTAMLGGAGQAASAYGQSRTSNALARQNQHLMAQRNKLKLRTMENILKAPE